MILNILKIKNYLNRNCLINDIDFIVLTKNFFGLYKVLNNQPKYNLSTKSFIGACLLVKKAMAAPVQNMESL